MLVDPVDGSLNAKQGVPVFGLMLSVLDGPLVSDALAGLVLNLNTGEEWKAVRAQGARRGGEPLTAMSRGYADRIQLLGLESTPRNLELARPLVERATKVRILGSMAISIALTSAGAFDVFCAPLPVRIFDMSASLLLLAETGGVATTIEGEPIGNLRCDLETRSTVLCGASPELHVDELRAVALEPEAVPLMAEASFVTPAPNALSLKFAGRKWPPRLLKRMTWNGWLTVTRGSPSYASLRCPVAGS